MSISSRSLKKSPWIVHYDGSSCNGCDIEVLACLTPLYDIERFGIINTGNPKHADILLITGSINEQNKEVVKNIYHQLAEPKVVVAIGICATSGGIFRECYNVSGGTDTVIPVDVYVPGCAVRPEAIIDGVVKALGVLEAKNKLMHDLKNNIDKMTISQADRTDLPEILAIQKTAFKSEAELYNNYNIQPLREKLENLYIEFDSGTIFLKAVVNGKIIGSIRAKISDSIVTISRLSVHPYFRGRGIGKQLLLNMENNFSSAQKFELFTGHLSKRNIYLYEKLGYNQIRSEKLSENLEHIFMEKRK
jgi:ech hydrogenase subunit C